MGQNLQRIYTKNRQSVLAETRVYNLLRARNFGVLWADKAEFAAYTYTKNRLSVLAEIRVYNLQRECNFGLLWVNRAEFAACTKNRLSALAEIWFLCLPQNVSSTDHLRCVWARSILFR